VDAIMVDFSRGAETSMEIEGDFFELENPNIGRKQCVERIVDSPEVYGGRERKVSDLAPCMDVGIGPSSTMNRNGSPEDDGEKILN
jgi:hypothetical protein